MASDVNDVSGSAPGASHAEPIYVRHVRHALDREFRALLDPSHMSRDEVSSQFSETVFYARALAALALRALTGCSSREAAESIIDGPGDNGIDALGVGTIDGVPELWLVQSKWSARGTARVNTNELLMLKRGLELLQWREYSSFNEKFSQLRPRVEAAVEHSRAKIHLVLAYMGTDMPSHSILAELTSRFKIPTDTVDYQILSGLDFQRIVRESASASPIDLTVRMFSQLSIPSTLRSYLGLISVGEVADWYEQHGQRLFDRNIRYPLGATQINEAIGRTLRERPEVFSTFNNGLTLVCARAEQRLFNRGATNGPAELHLRDVQIVNGAQTVQAIYDAVRENPESALRAMVSLRVIATDGAPDEMITDITIAGNYQNSVTARDLAAVDPVQYRIRDSLALELDKTYVIKRGDIIPPPEDGCTLDEAIIALACAHSNLEHCARVCADPESIWERNPASTYSTIFQSPLSGPQLWRAVQVHRAVRAALSSSQTSLSDRVALITKYASFLVNNVVFRSLATELFESDEDETWRSEVIERIPGAAPAILRRIVAHALERHHDLWNPKATFEDADECKALAEAVLTDISTGTAMPELPDWYDRENSGRATRRPSSVTLLVQSHAIPNGTSLYFEGTTSPERRATREWLSVDPRRGQAIWDVGNAPTGKPMRWAVDNHFYSPSGLTLKIWEEAGWQAQPVAAQGAIRWHVASGETLSELAEHESSER